jgi:hypothetical protein
LLAAASAAAAVLIASAVYLVADGRSGEPPAGAAASVAVTVPPSAPAAAAALPAGFRWYTSPSGFRLASPDGWRRTGESRTGVTLRHAGEATLVSVREWQPSDPDLSAALRREETAATLRDYRRVRLDATPQRDTAEWEYTFTDPAAGPLHALDRAVTRGGRSYLIRWRTPAGEWVANLATRDAVLDSFRPAG